MEILKRDEVLRIRTFKRRVANEMVAAAGKLTALDDQVDQITAQHVSGAERASLRGVVAMLMLAAEQWVPR